MSRLVSSCLVSSRLVLSRLVSSRLVFLTASQFLVIEKKDFDQRNPRRGLKSMVVGRVGPWTASYEEPCGLASAGYMVIRTKT